MTKEFEALSNVRQFVLKYARFENVVGDNANGSKTLIELDIIKQALTELQAIKEAKPSEALECLKSLDIQVRFMGILDIPSWEKHLPTIKQALLKAEKLEKALKVIKKYLIDTDTTIHIHLDTKDEFDSLREALEND